MWKNTIVPKLQNYIIRNVQRGPRKLISECSVFKDVNLDKKSKSVHISSEQTYLSYQKVAFFKKRFFTVGKITKTFFKAALVRFQNLHNMGLIKHVL